MKKVIFVYPNSLFEDNELIKNNPNTTIYLIEDPTYFTMYNYHKMKLVLHRSSMKYYENYIKAQYKNKVNYIEFNYNFDKLYKSLKGFDVLLYDPVEHSLDFDKIGNKYDINFEIYDTPLFLDTEDDLKNYMKYKLNNKKILHSDFYKYQRKLHNVLMENNGKFTGNSLSFDKENRLPFPKNINKDIYDINYTNKYVKEAQNYINKHFKNNPGSDKLYLPIEFDKVKEYFKNFIKKKLDNFGPYEDAVSKNINFGYHSVLSPLTNIGLITPKYIIETIKKIKINKNNLQSIEGYVRQIIGWREYCRLIYTYKRKELEKNYFNHKNKINKSWYTYNINTGFKFIDDMVKKTLDLGYLHHIERLMYIGNYFLINQINPKDVFNWFQSMFLDSYHVFMYPNVYGMSQHSSGPIMMTRPYFSASSYIDKMSDYKKKDKYDINNNNWNVVWDAIYYNFINDNINLFKKNYAVANQVKNWQNNPNKKEILKIASEYHKKYL